MTTPQIILLSVLAIIAIIGFSGAMTSTKENNKINYTVLLFFTTACFALISFVSINMANEYYKKSKGKCPEYERIENVYKLKQ